MSTSNETTYSARAQRHASIDTTVPRDGRAKSERIELGLQLMSIAREPGSAFTLQEIACWCGCTRDAILLVQEKALKKLRHRLKFGPARLLGREMDAA